MRNRDEHTPLTASPSEDLLLRFQAGEEACLDRLWARYYPRLKRWAHGRLPAASRGDVSTDDLIQDAFVRSLASLRTLRPQGPNSLFAYFRTIVLNKIRDYGRKATRQPRPEELLTDQHLDAGASPLEQVLGLELMQQYERALSTLAENDQQLILAFVELRCSDRELADLFEKPSVDAARMARGRALARLADAMAGVVRSDPAGRSIL